ncbi:MAG: indole-3-glycerol phosphate synthase TrpC [Planctomycetota bacterium]
MTSTGTKLDPIIEKVRARAAERRRKQPLARLEEVVKPDSWRRERFLTALHGKNLAFITEMKRRSPSAGRLLEEPSDPRGSVTTRSPRPGPRWHALAESYLRGGAHALSVLTEEDHFEGTLDDLRAVEFTRLPRLRKDFILDEGMVIESGLYGADALLLLPVILSDAELATARNVAREYGFAVLMEVHDEAELERVLPLEPELVGVNARDLKTLHVDLATVERLLPLVPTGPKGPLRVAESGIKTADDLKRVRAAGADAVLVGETLVRAVDAAVELKQWREALGG